MSTRKSPLYTILAILFSFVILAGGAAKLYRGINILNQSGSDPKVRELLMKGDASVEDANQQSIIVAPLFQELLGEFDRLGIAAFRSEKREDCEKIRGQFVSVNKRLQEASLSILDATKIGVDKKTNEFLMARSKSYDLLMSANEKNIDILSTILDESITELDAVIEKVQTIAMKRGEDEKAAAESSAIADQIANLP